MKKFLNWLKNNWPLVLVVIIGGLLRFYRLPDLATFGGDQGVDYQNVAKMIAEKRLSLLGPVTHVGIFLGPLYYYLLIPFFLIFKFDPVAAPVMFALFGTATVGLVYILTKQIFVTISGLRLTDSDSFPFLTSLLYAVSPVILESSRSPSQPHLIPFFATLLLISIIRIARKEGHWWDWVVLGICLGSLIQLHFLTFPIYIFFIIIMLKFFTSIKLKRNFILHTAYCLLFTFLLLSPWLLFELRHNFFITNQIITYLQSGEVGFQPVEYLERVLDLIWFSFDRLVGQGNQLITTLAIVLGLAGFMSIKVRPWLRSRSDLSIPAEIIVIYFFINVLGVSLYLFPLSNHYISALYPIIISFISIGVALLLPRLLALIAFISLIIFISFHNNFSSNHGYTMPEWVNMSLIKKAADIISADLNQHPGTYNVVNTLDGDTRAHPYRYVLAYRKNIPPLGVEKYSESDYLYIISGNSTNELLGDKRWELLSFPVGNIEELGLVGGNIKMYRWDNGKADRKDLKK